MIIGMTIFSIIAVIGYAIFSIYLKKPVGLFIASVMHILLGIITLPSIGLYVFVIAAIEIVIGIGMIIKGK